MLSRAGLGSFCFFRICRDLTYLPTSPNPPVSSPAAPSPASILPVPNRPGPAVMVQTPPASPIKLTDFLDVATLQDIQ